MLDPIKTNMATLRYRGKRLEHAIIISTTFVLLAVSVYNIYLGFVQRKQIYRYEQKIAQLQREQDAEKKQTKQNAVPLKKEDIESIQMQIVSTNRIIAEDIFPWDRLLNSLEMSIPSEVTLEKMTVEDGFRELKLAGRSNSVDSVTLFLNNLEKTNSYRRVELANLNLNQSERIAFNITGRLDMQALLPPAQYGDLWKILD